MNIFYSLPTRVLFISATLLGLCACGGGGGSEEAASTPPPSSDKCTTQVAGSTRLCDNPLTASTSFENFRTEAAIIPVPAIISSNGFVGTRVFLKITGSESPDPLTGAGQQVLYLGQVSASQDFSIPLHVALSETSLFYEVFSDSASDDIVFGELPL